MNALRRLPWRTFLAAFILALCVLSLICAFFVIECRIQQTIHGRVDLGVTYTIEDGVPVVILADSDETLAVPPVAGQVCEIVVPPPARLFAELWRWENEIAERLWKFLSEQ